MRKILAVIAALLFALPVQAVVQARDDAGSVITLLQTPCENKGVLTQLPELNALLIKAEQPARVAGDFYSAVFFYRGKEFGACWTPVGEAIVIVDDSGDGSVLVLPAAAFRSVRSI